MCCQYYKATYLQHLGKRLNTPIGTPLRACYKTLALWLSGADYQFHHFDISLSLFTKSTKHLSMVQAKQVLRHWLIMRLIHYPRYWYQRGVPWADHHTSPLSQLLKELREATWMLMERQHLHLQILRWCSRRPCKSKNHLLVVTHFIRHQPKLILGHKWPSIDMGIVIPAASKRFNSLSPA